MLSVVRIKQFEGEHTHGRVDTLLHRRPTPNSVSNSVAVSKIIYKKLQTKKCGKDDAHNYTPEASASNDEPEANDKACLRCVAQEATKQQARNWVYRQRSQPEKRPFAIAAVQCSLQTKHTAQTPYSPRILHYTAEARDRTKEAEPVGEDVTANQTKQPKPMPIRSLVNSNACIIGPV